MANLLHWSGDLSSHQLGKPSLSFLHTEKYFQQFKLSEQHWLEFRLRWSTPFEQWDENALKKVPTSMVLGVLINSVLAFGFVLTLLFFLGDPITTLMSPTGYPVIETYQLRMLTRALGLVAVFVPYWSYYRWQRLCLLCSYLPRCSRTLHLIYRTNCPLPVTQAARLAPAIQLIQSWSVRHSGQRIRRLLLRFRIV